MLTGRWVRLCGDILGYMYVHTPEWKLPKNWNLHVAWCDYGRARSCWLCWGERNFAAVSPRYVLTSNTQHPEYGWGASKVRKSSPHSNRQGKNKADWDWLQHRQKSLTTRNIRKKQSLATFSLGALDEERGHKKSMKEVNLMKLMQHQWLSFSQL